MELLRLDVLKTGYQQELFGLGQVQWRYLMKTVVKWGPQVRANFLVDLKYYQLSR
jgi:hypothetical protein